MGQGRIGRSTGSDWGHGQRRGRRRHDLRNEQWLQQQEGNPLQDLRRERCERHAQRDPRGNSNGSRQRGIPRRRVRARHHDRLRRHAAAGTHDLGGRNRASGGTRRSDEPDDGAHRRGLRLQSQRTDGERQVLQGICGRSQRDHGHGYRNRTDAARDTGRCRRIETHAHRRSARRGVHEHPDRLRGLPIRGQPQRPLLLRRRRLGRLDRRRRRVHDCRRGRSEHAGALPRAGLRPARQDLQLQRRASVRLGGSEHPFHGAGGQHAVPCRQPRQHQQRRSGAVARHHLRRHDHRRRRQHPTDLPRQL